MTVTFLGTGTSTGVPVLACDCEVCTSKDPRDERLRTSALVSIGNQNIVIDCGPDFRAQMLNNKIKDIDAIIFTHSHRDHTAGLDDIRGFNFILNKHIDVYGTKEVFDALKEQFPYVFNKTKYLGAPRIVSHEIDIQPFKIENTPIIPIKAWHHRMEVFGYRIFDFSYLTDANKIPDAEMEKLKSSKTLVINTLRKSPHLSHFCLPEALDIIKKINPDRAYLTHMSHFIGKHEDIEKELPSNVRLAYDGLQIEL